jgi:hypothetical protein
MHDDQPLSRFLGEYYLGHLDRKQLEGQVFQFILNHHQQYHLRGWDKEEVIDFLCWLYPRIHNAIDNYKRTGSSFDAYMGALINWSAREYRTRETDHWVIENAFWGARAMDMMAHNHEPEYLEPKPALEQVPNPRQILVLLLKSYYFISDDFAARVAPALGLTKEKLTQLINAIRQQRVKREEEIRGLRERIHGQYYRCITFERRLHAAPEGSLMQAKMERCLVTGKKRLASMRKRLSKIRLDASNQQVARVLKVPKGTVDSNLAALKARMRIIDRGKGDDPSLN